MCTLWSTTLLLDQTSKKFTKGWQATVKSTIPIKISKSAHDELFFKTEMGTMSEHMMVPHENINGKGGSSSESLDVLPWFPIMSGFSFSAKKSFDNKLLCIWWHPKDEWQQNWIGCESLKEIAMKWSLIQNPSTKDFIVGHTAVGGQTKQLTADVVSWWWRQSIQQICGFRKSTTGIVKESIDLCFSIGGQRKAHCTLCTDKKGGSEHGGWNKGSGHEHHGGGSYCANGDSSHFRTPTDKECKRTEWT